MTVGSLRRLLEWLRDLDARYGYVKRARVMPGDPAPVRQRKVADTSEVVLVNPTTPVAAPPPPPAPRSLAPLPYVDASDVDGAGAGDDGPIQVVFAPSVAEVDAALDAEPEATGYEDVEDELEAEEETELEEELAAAELEPPTSVLPPVEPHAPSAGAISRLRSHRPD